MTNLRPDLKLIAELVEPGSKLLDIGCGDGELLAWLRDHKQVDGRGIEISQAGVSTALAQGLSVVQGDADTDLRYYADQCFDYVILSHTIQATKRPKEVLDDMMRIARYGIVSIPNFGYWKNRLYFTLKGRMPVTSTLSYEWYETPNIHFCTIKDFVILCKEMHIDICRQFAVDGKGQASGFTGTGGMFNLFGASAVFKLTRKGQG